MAFVSQAIMSQSCSPTAFNHPAIFGAEVVRLEANLLTKYSIADPYSVPSVQYSGLEICNVSVEYTHPGYNDNINTQVWLPVENWNGRLQGSGGGGFQTGLYDFWMAPAVQQGYAVVSTDGGHVLNSYDPSSWALTSPGNVNWYLLQDYASTALGETAVIGKAIAKDFYGRAPSKSYWNGCSTGGRQGLMLAQRYPDAYDGILAAAPAINFDEFVTSEVWPQVVMHEAGHYPPPCEFDAITKAAVEACDQLDGVKDGIISSPELCGFDPKALIGKTIDCASMNGQVKISELAVNVVETAWRGAHRPDGTKLWDGITHEASLTGPLGLANTVCKDGACKPQAFAIGGEWVKWFLKKDPDFDLTTLKLEEASRLFQLSHQQYGSVMGTNDPDLSEFREAGGKMITWHGLADQVIMPNGTIKYYDTVTQLDPHVQDYYRFFEAPGVQHCWGGAGPAPIAPFDILVEWVESGKAPDILPARSLADAEGLVYERNLCAYPKKAKYKGDGDIRISSSFECV